MSNNAKDELTLQQRMLSACSGSLLTSLTLTPMDVVRIRLQQQELLPDCSCGPIEKVITASVSKQKLKTDLSTVQAKLVAPIINKNKLFWESPCFQQLNCKNSSVRFNSTWEAFTKISKLEGITTLWRGISINLLMAVPANIVYFTGYEYMRDNSPISKSFPNFNPLLCGAFARIVAATVVAPLELTKTKLQSIPRSSKSTSSWMLIRELLKETRQEMKVNGIYRALFKGLEITLWRDVPFSAIYWGSYEFCKNHFWIDTDPSLNVNWIQFINSFVSGSVSGTLAAIFTHPFDVGKTRWQISFFNAPDKALVTSSKNNKAVVSKNMFKFLGNIWKTEGAGALYVGLLPRIIKIAPSCAIMISSYEISKKIFNS
ncbi:Mtm1p NDAI_0B00880 [Naumovozyma dairenensis CBS 421]|uniref:Mitochondrial carrier protein MTM1 n=1 Tax=Naumovozyma dairenensis (strain ATCC 10597 / BCRC 20456 / CBS 421 / NBRC 0211 / NRRL Y-12639) TaxID=1071378 RepID=G0W5R1_NAUDC|nr:hypothetical protein NDAI_0B00880 [Naumovozyma dairenensis CBS 421]CCD23122.1 hypothetical protein NDAI_0B00880 [Naumovozyma dairenensis CBS 421]